MMIKQLFIILLGISIGFFLPFGIGLLFWPIQKYDPVWAMCCCLYSIFCGIFFGINAYEQN